MSRPSSALIIIVAFFSVLLGYAAVSTNQQTSLVEGAIAASSKTVASNKSVLNTNQQQSPPAPRLEGCVTCHGQIEPMHKYGTTETLEKLNDGKDAVGLTCTGCHGGNPVPRKTSDDPKSIEQIKNEAHVRARFPSQWQRDG